MAWVAMTCPDNLNYPEYDPFDPYSHSPPQLAPHDECLEWVPDCQYICE